MVNIINSFKYDNAFLSNFFPKPTRIYSTILGRDIVFDTNEHFYQAAKTIDPEEKMYIISAPSPYVAKKRGRKATMVPHWDQIKYAIMLFGVRRKFQQNRDLYKKLYYTYPAILIEGNNWCDNTWGDCWCAKCKNKKGLNWLGEILMVTRGEYSI